MKTFNCKTCGLLHRLITLFEFPTPIIIADITSGRLEQQLNILAKNSFLIDKKYLLIESVLPIDIIDFEDTLDMLVWVKITSEEFQSKFKKPFPDKIKLKGVLNHSIPFYKNKKEIPVDITVDLNSNDVPIVTNIRNRNKLKNDLKHGITLDRLTEILALYYHNLQQLKLNNYAAR